VGTLPFLILVSFVLLAGLASWVLPYSPEALDLNNRRAAPSVAHPFGTDDLGRDVLARVVHGGRVSLAIGLLSALVAALIGTAVGMTSGYAGGWIDHGLMRLTDAALAMPRLPLLMVAAAILTPGLGGLVLLVGAAGWMELARLVRAETLSLKARDFVAAARAAGASARRVAVHHLLPAVVPTLVVATTVAVARAILLESALSFFGVGVQPPTPSWGGMLYQAQGSMATEPWLALFPGVAIFATALAVNALGESLRDLADGHAPPSRRPRSVRDGRHQPSARSRELRE